MTTSDTRFDELMSKGHSSAWDMQWEDAASYYRMALEESPESPKAKSNLAAAYFELGEFEQALILYMQLVEHSREDPFPLEKMAEILELRGQKVDSSAVSLRTGNLYKKRGDVTKAIENWKRSIRLDPGNFKARSQLALALEKKGEVGLAVEQYVTIGSLLQKSGNKVRAQEVLQHAMSLEPENKKISQALGLLRANQPLPMPQELKPEPVTTEVPIQPTSALPEPDSVQRQKSPDPITEAENRAISTLAEIIFEGNDDGGASELGRNLGSFTAETGPLFPSDQKRNQMMFHLSQALELHSRSKFGLAAEELERATLSNLDHGAAHFILGLLLQRDQQFKSALKSLERSVRDPEYELASRLLMGAIYRADQNILPSTQEYLKALQIADSAVVEPDFAEVLREGYTPIIETSGKEKNKELQLQLVRSIADLLVQENWREKLNLVREQLPSSGPGQPPIPLAEILAQGSGGRVVELLSKIQGMAQNGYYRHAMEEAYHALDVAPTYLPLHTFMGEILLEQENIQGAIAKFHTVARAYSARGEFIRAIDVLRKITGLAPLNLTARDRLIELLMQAGKTEETIREYLEIGEVYYRLAELDKARNTYQKAFTFAEENQIDDSWKIMVLHRLADIDQQRLDWQQALQVFSQIVEIDPMDEKAAMGIVDLNLRLMEDTPALSALGNYVAALQRDGEGMKAINTLQELLKNHPDQLALRRTLAEQYEQVGKLDDAIDQWDSIADSLLEAGDTQGAIQAVQAILALNPLDAHQYEKFLRELENQESS